MSIKPIKTPMHFLVTKSMLDDLDEISMASGETRTKILANRYRESVKS